MTQVGGEKSCCEIRRRGKGRRGGERKEDMRVGEVGGGGGRSRMEMRENEQRR